MLRKITLAISLWAIASIGQAQIQISQVPLLVSQSAPPLNMLVMGRDHKLYYEAYNDASDLDNDGVIDVGFKPAITYYGYFNTATCYESANGRFEPIAAAGDKNICSNAWSGNFLNYLATSRMDALRKVLYGGYRATDTASETVLRAAFIPQDAHSSGKEYDPARDKFSISDYAPLSAPVAGYRHMFAVTTLSDGGTPILRVLTNSQYRIWDWVSKEGPVASDKCVNNETSCLNGGSNNWAIAPASFFPNGLAITTWHDNTGSPSDKGPMDSLFAASHTKCGTGSVSAINTTGENNNPFAGANGCTNDSYHTLITGTLRVPATGHYYFGVNGDDAVDFFVDSTRVAYWYGGHGANSNAPGGTTSSIYLTADTNYTIKFRHEEGTGGDNWQLYYKAPNAAASTMTDYALNVLACPSDANLRESNCKTYTDNSGKVSYKPTGLLHDFGENDSMKFGLLTGSYAKNTKGGVLRSNIASFTREVNSATGQFNTNVTDGIVATLDKLRIVDFSYSNHQYTNCGWIGDVPITSKNDGMCTMWGNPLAEMMFEGLRYFAGATAGSSAYTYQSNARDTQSDLGLPAPTWVPPYTAKPGGAGEKSCAAPVMTVISDINPSYDYTLPGSRFNEAEDSFSLPSSLSDLDVSSSTDEIGVAEKINGQSYFIGQSTADNANSAPTAKVLDGLSYARGLSPEEPSKQGTFYSAGIAKFAAENVVGGDKKMLTYSIALASPLPQIRFPIGTDGSQGITLAPFAKSVGSTDNNNSYGINAKSSFQPTNQIVDYYVVTIANTAGPTGADYDASVNEGRPYAQFRINYEDMEQGADHDMDAIALYTLSVDANGVLTIKIDSEYASGGIIQHMGYVISGTNADGIYLEVRDADTASDNKSQHYQSYKLNTPPNQWPGYCDNATNLNKSECKQLPLNATRSFTAASSQAAGFLKDPLWYAAKYGVPDRLPDTVKGDPDNYFLVTNATTLKDQLTKAFNDILQRNTSITSPVVEGNTTEDGSFIYRTDFKADGWTGDLIKEELKQVDGSSQLETIWRASEQLPTKGTRNILFAPAGGKGDLVEFSWDSLEDREFVGINLQEALNKPANGEADGLGENRVDYITENCSDINCADFRVPKSRLGDIINSSPVLVEGAQYLPHRADTLDGTAGAYRLFQNSIKDRPGIVYVGANDGMLHAFYSGTGVDADQAGKEAFAFIPTAVISNLNKLTDPQYGIEAGELHQYFVDGTPVVADVYFGDGEGDDKGWRTVLVSSLGAGGKAIFALDITDPEQPKLLWEFTDPAMGDSIPQPSIARLHSGQWAALIPNGYNSGTNPTLFALDIKTGAKIRTLTTLHDPDDLTTTASTTGNGLSNIRTADMNGDGIVDYVYGGDQLGNVWRFDLYNVSAGNLNKCTTNCASVKDQFRVSFGGKPLYVAKEAAEGQPLPITAAPTLLRHPTSIGHLVMVGTGRYLGSADKYTSTPKQESLYGIWDRQTDGRNATSTPELSRSDLREQTLSADGTMQIGNETRPVRLITDHTVQWYNHEGLPDSDRCVPSNNEDSPDASVNCWGWRLDLTSSGERVVNNMQMYGEALIFSTITPSDDSCSSGLDGFTYAINPATGGRTYFNVFDLNGDGSVDTGDGKDGNVVSGFGNPAGDFTIHDGFLYSPDGKRIPVDHGSLAKGRQSWHLIPPPKPAAPSTPESGE